MNERPGNQLFDAYFTTRDMREVFCDAGRVQAMLDVEAALARAEARVGLIPQGAVAPIENACQARLYDFAALGEAIASAGNSAIPLSRHWASGLPPPTPRLNATCIWAPPART